MQDYLSKPISVDKLHRTLAKWLQASATTDTEAVDPESLETIRNLRGVGGDKMVKKVVDLYLTSSSSLVEGLCSGLSQGNAEAVRQGAHALKSSSQNVGANALAALSQKLEEMGRSGELEDTERYRVELDRLYPRTVLALKAAVQRVER
jgi:HPt (histidine-containing phosphotransfer) domain-containing protein